MPDLIQENTARDLAATDSSIASTCERMIREQIPNLLRLHVNPHVTQACYCLTHYIAESWPGAVGSNDYQVFLANSGDEALSGAIKLARYAANRSGGPRGGLIIDDSDRFEHFAFTELGALGRLEFLPGVDVVRDPRVGAKFLASPNSSWGFVVISHDLLRSGDALFGGHFGAQSVGRRPLLIVYADRKDLGSRDHPPTCPPDIVIFDESFVNRAVPFGAFAATKPLFLHWNGRGMTTFHSTTYQPNTISTLHLMNCLRNSNPDFIARHYAELKRIEDDPEFRYAMFRDLYSRSLARLASTVGTKDGPVRAAGHYFSVSGGKRIFDGVAGVACSVRGHNPPSYVADIRQCGDLDSCRDELMDRLTGLTGLSRMVPAVSGASAVEHALKIGLASQFPRDYVLALRGGFGGKTLFALTGTWKPSLKSGIAPLYPKVVYVDPFANDAIAAVRSAFHQYPIGVVQLELIQGVGGVRAVPNPVLQCLAEMRSKTDCLLFVDEVQTGMFRTGPFTRSNELGVQPDLLTIGKGTSDMMFPFALTLYSDAIQRKLVERECRIADVFTARCDYETGIRTVLGTLRRAAETNLTQQARDRSVLFAKLLREGLRTSRLVRDIRCFGLLIGIELDDERLPHRWLGKFVYQLYLLAMLKHRDFPLLAGFCQYEPNVLKLTPPLSVTEDEVHSVCGTISAALHTPLHRVAVSGLMSLTIQPQIARWRRRFRKEYRQ